MPHAKSSSRQSARQPHKERGVVLSPSNGSPPEHPIQEDDLLAIASRVWEAQSVDPTALFSETASDSHAHLDLNLSVFKYIVNLMKQPFHTDVTFAPTCGAKELSASIFSQIEYLRWLAAEAGSADKKLTKAETELNKMEKSIDNLERERNFLGRELEKVKERREEIAEGMQARMTELEQRRNKLREHEEEVVLLRNAMAKARQKDLEARRRLDRMRLKVSALRGEMISQTVDQMFEREAMEVDDSVSSIEGDPLRHVLGFPPEKRNDGEKKEGEVDVEGMEGVTSAGGKGDEHEFDEDAEETQLRLLRNRLAMCENEAKEWKESLDAEEEAVRLVTKAKARLEDELQRAKQPSSKAGAGSRSGGKGGASRTVARIRAHARASLEGAADGRKVIKKSRKGRPQRSLMPN